MSTACGLYKQSTTAMRVPYPTVIQMMTTSHCLFSTSSISNLRLLSMSMQGPLGLMRITSLSTSSRSATKPTAAATINPCLSLFEHLAYPT